MADAGFALGHDLPQVRRPHRRPADDAAGAEPGARPPGGRAGVPPAGRHAGDRPDGLAPPARRRVGEALPDGQPVRRLAHPRGQGLVRARVCRRQLCQGFRQLRLQQPARRPDEALPAAQHAGAAHGRRRAAPAEEPDLCRPHAPRRRERNLVPRHAGARRRLGGLVRALDPDLGRADPGRTHNHGRLGGRPRRGRGVPLDDPAAPHARRPRPPRGDRGSPRPRHADLGRGDRGGLRGAAVRGGQLEGGAARAPGSLPGHDAAPRGPAAAFAPPARPGRPAGGAGAARAEVVSRG